VHPRDWSAVGTGWMLQLGLVLAVLTAVTGPALAASTHDARSAHIWRLIRQQYVHGMPYDSVLALGSGATPALAAMLSQEAYHDHWDNIVTAIEMLGDSSSFDILRSFVWNRFYGEVDNRTFDALVNATKDLGLLVSRSPEVLDYLRSGTDPRFWQELTWHTKNYDGARLSEQMAKMSMLGLGGSGDSGAESTLVTLQHDPRYAGYRSQLDTSLRRLRRILAAGGPEAFMRARPTPRREK
jgi:hypothetical protein